jgi:hypothetical protein
MAIQTIKKSYQRRSTKSVTNKTGNFNLVSSFKGYRARLDQTNEELGTLVSPSQNVVMNTAGRVATVKGYALDGSASSANDSGILSNFDFNTFKSDVRNMRAGFLTTALNDGKLQYRYVTGANTINWVDLKTGLTNVRLSYTEYWDNVALVKLLLWVDGSNNVFSWNGAVTTFFSATATTITKQDSTKTWAQEGYGATGSIVINGVTATYTGGNATQTLTGVSVDFSATAVGSIVHQAVITTTLASMTAIFATLAPTTIGCGRSNQVYLGSSTSNSLYISKVNDYKNYTFTVPTRLVGEGNLIPLDAPPTAFVPLEMRSDENGYDMYISEGSDRWAVIRSILSADLTAEKLEHLRLKVAPLQGAKSARLVTKMKNHIAYLGNDGVANFFGNMSYQNVPSLTDFSYSIIDDMKSYDLTDGAIFYFNNYVYVAIPKAGVIRVYNMTDQTQQPNIQRLTIEDVSQQPWFWEAPITYPISGFYVVNGELYGHSYTNSESYKLFTGGKFNAQNISANATFSYWDGGDRTSTSASDEVWVEGYIKQNTILTVTINTDLGSFAGSQTTTIDGSDISAVSFGSGGHALGKNPLGSEPLGGAITVKNTLPAWFRAIRTYPNIPCFLEQLSFSSNGTDLQWELLSFGTNSSITAEGNNEIRK